MTKLRRLDPQPADLTTHKGPFVTAGGIPARLICLDCKYESFPLVFLVGEFEEECVRARSNGKGIGLKSIFAAEEIREPEMFFLVVLPGGSRCSPFYVEQEAIVWAKENGGVVRRYAEDTNYGGGV